MNLDAISSHWTPQERLEVIAEISGKAFAGEMHHRLALETINDVSKKPTEYLEQNRERITEDAA